jgi:hypothetical protein
MGICFRCERVKGSFASEAVQIVTLFPLMFSAGAPLGAGLSSPVGTRVRRT